MRRYRSIRAVVSQGFRRVREKLVCTRDGDVCSIIAHYRGVALSDGNSILHGIYMTIIVATMNRSFFFFFLRDALTREFVQRA